MDNFNSFSHLIFNFLLIILKNGYHSFGNNQRLIFQKKKKENNHKLLLPAYLFTYSL
jgi:hypothetical protein